MLPRRVFGKATAVRVLAAALAIAALSGLNNNTSAQATQPGYTPLWEPTACKHDRAPGSTTYCGYMVVPERREAPTGHAIKVYHVIMPAVNGSPSGPPVMYLTGGPGASTWSAVNLFEMTTGPAAIYRQKFGGTRDLIIVDQRGTNQSIPALYCDTETAPLRSTVYGADFPLASSLRVQALNACRQRWIREGVNLSGYDDYEVAADVADFLRLRGLPRINLYGASWGTRVTMQVMKLYPQIVNAAVIDSILPPELNPFVAEVQGTQFGIQALIDNSRSAYPLIQTYINTILERLRVRPVDVVGYHYPNGPGACSAPGTGGVPYVVHITADKFIDYLAANQLRSTPYCTNLPKNIKFMFDQQRYDIIADSWISSMDFSFSASGPVAGAPANAMFQSVFAANDAFYARPTDVLANILRNVTESGLAMWLENSFIYREPAMVGSWPVDPLPASVRLPVISTIPTMMLVGTLDTATPSIFSRPSQVGLPNSVYYEIVSGHATAYLPCVLDMLDAWLQRPGVPTGNQCPQTYTWDPPATSSTLTFDAAGTGTTPASTTFRYDPVIGAIREVPGRASGTQRR
jgi:pimeloyl-ACP methyl ester carboxylesterase